MSNKIENTEFNKAYKLQCHADDHYAHRINFFLVAESMFIISFVTSLTNSRISNGIGGFIAIIGFIFSLIWLYTNARLERRTIIMIEKYLKKDPIYQVYINSAGGIYSKALLTYTLPNSMIILWITFVIYQLRVQYIPFWVLILIGFFSVFSFWLEYYHLQPNTRNNH